MKFLIFLWLFSITTVVYYPLYIWQCVHCKCRFYGKNPPYNSKCLHPFIQTDIWELKEIKYIPIKSKEMS